MCDDDTQAAVADASRTGRSLDKAVAYCVAHGYEVEFAIPARHNLSDVYRVHLCWMRQDVQTWDATSLDRALEAAIGDMDAIRATYMAGQPIRTPAGGSENEG